MARFLRLLVVSTLLVACDGCFGGWLHGSWEIVAEPPRQFAWEKDTTTVSPSVNGGTVANNLVGADVTASSNAASGVVTITRERGR